jgi:holo-[acyl-carrier protein] synthase
LTGGVGIDIVKLERIESLWKAHGALFLERILSGEEIGAIPEKFPVEYIGGRFAAKEAIVKAVGRRGFEFSKISILNDEAGRPFIKEKSALGTALARTEDSFSIYVSISHEREYCVGLAILEFF